MSKIGDLKKELRELRKKHCPPTGKMKKADVEKEIERLKGMEKHTEFVAPEPKPRVKKAKKETREMEVQTEEEEKPKSSMAERMAKVRAAKGQKESAEDMEKKKQEVKKKNEETMAKALGQLRQVEKEVAGRNKARKEIAEMMKPAEKKPKSKVRSMAIALDEKIKESKEEEKPKRKLKKKD